ncbi:nuclear transport factor 2 family protein [Microbulbifer epialgicus]|uniref:Nuclear transport factor 2 family protein n=1 Tax=Microbulbifer epialgicus TaxID=393907 RepID=A0ABV4P0Y4_9GAMM
MRAITMTLLFVLATGLAHADDRQELQKLLHNFIANAADSAEAHKRFWAEDLIYTSSAGKRFGKGQIMRGMENPSGETVSVTYAAEDVDIRLLGDTAVVAFQLVANDHASGKTSHYLNTGTFVKRQGKWQVLAWQATKIPMGN